MTKDAFYFSHDNNARNDEKLIAVRMQLGAAGYGIYFMILERLMESSGYTSRRNYDIISFDLRVDAETVRQVIEDYGLFSFNEEGTHFWSESLVKRMQSRERIREQRRKAGLCSAEKRKKKTGETTKKQQPPDECCNKNQQGKEKKGKEPKEKENLSDESAKKEGPDSPTPPLLSDYEKFRIWLSEHAPFCANPKNFPKQISETQLGKLKENYSGSQIADMLIRLENRKDLRKRYCDLYQTLCNWLKKEYNHE